MVRGWMVLDVDVAECLEQQEEYESQSTKTVALDTREIGKASLQY